jgi:hypothetical protein
MLVANFDILMYVVALLGHHGRSSPKINSILQETGLSSCVHDRF